MVQFEEILDDDCHCVVDCFADLDESSADRFVNTAVCTGHPVRRHTGRNHRLLDSVHRDIGHDRCPLTFGCRCGSGRHRGGNRHHGVDDPVTVGAHYPYYGRFDARLAVSSCF